MIRLFHTKSDAEEVQIVREVLESGNLVMGPHIEALERELGEFLGGGEAVCCASGTDALIIALEITLGAKMRGRGVVVPAMTFSATYEAVLRAGYIPKVCDVDPASLTPTVDHVRQAWLDSIGNGTSVAAVIIVHLYGWPARHILEIRDFCSEQNLLLIEDAAQAFGASRDGIMVGQFGQAGIYSFYPTKPLGGIGDGGAVYYENAPYLASQARSLRNHGRTNIGQLLPGFNSRMDEANAAILRHRLNNYAANVIIREQMSGRYHLNGLKKLSIDRKGGGVPYVYPILSSDRDEIRARLADVCQTGVHYDPAVSGLPYVKAQCPAADWGAKATLSLPCHHKMTVEDVDRICDAVRG